MTRWGRAFSEGERKTQRHREGWDRKVWATSESCELHGSRWGQGACLKGSEPKVSSLILRPTALRLQRVSEASGGLFLKCSVPGPDLRDLYSLDPRQHQRMCLLNVFPILERWSAAFSLLHAILPSSCCSHTCMCNHTYAYTQAHTCTHALSFLCSQTLAPTLFRGQTSATHFLKGLSDPAFIPQFCFSLALIIAREIQNQDTYSKLKYYFNLMAPVIAMPGQILQVNAKVKSGL